MWTYAVVWEGVRGSRGLGRRLRHRPAGDGRWKGEPTTAIEEASYQSNEVDTSKNAARERIGGSGAHGGEALKKWSALGSGPVEDLEAPQNFAQDMRSGAVRQLLRNGWAEAQPLLSDSNNQEKISR